jgi:hypothetical protein
VVARVALLAPAARQGRGPSVAVRRLAIAALATRLGVHPSRVGIVSEKRIPRVEIDGRRAPIDLSLSHHGRLVAFAFLWRPHPLERASTSRC